MDQEEEAGDCLILFSCWVFPVGSVLVNVMHKRKFSARSVVTSWMTIFIAVSPRFYSSWRELINLSEATTHKGRRCVIPSSSLALQRAQRDNGGKEEHRT